MEEINEIANDVMEEANADESESQHSTDDYDELEKSSCQGKYHKQSYRKAWESLPDFKGWLQGVVGQKNRAFCSYCQVTLFAHRLSLLKHTCTIKHQRASQKALLKRNGLMNDNAEVSIVPCTSQSTMQHISPDKLNIRPAKIQPNISGNMTVTIIQHESDDHLGLQLAQNMSESDNGALITDDDDLGLNTVSSVGLEVEEVMEGQIDASPSKSMNMAHSSAFPLSTHVLDTSKGQPVAQLPVSLYRLIDSRWTLINESVTNQDGRCSSLIQKQEFVAGRYKLHFDTDRYFELERKETLYPFVEIAFDVHAPLDHYHIPLLLSAFGYSTYRGS
ncbi:uncharacterized protein LOC117653581 isoform X1 [Thrips palmi]|uniref:hydroxyisourate hydrolase n=1 Tax=Thrips palmi TaxID=161013 RepID=A0A6P9AAZ7_THRPL|nr:uncharacterized protein LOC117653581 isoform X1 [Thrips palmi]